MKEYIIIKEEPSEGCGCLAGAGIIVFVGGFLVSVAMDLLPLVVVALLIYLIGGGIYTSNLEKKKAKALAEEPDRRATRYWICKCGRRNNIGKKCSCGFEEIPSSKHIYVGDTSLEWICQRCGRIHKYAIDTCQCGSKQTDNKSY